MVEKGWIGEKQGQGFYKKVKSEAGKEIQSLDLNTMDIFGKPQNQFSLSGSCEASERYGREVKGFARR